MTKARYLLLTVSHINNFDWDNIYEDIKNKRHIYKEDIAEVVDLYKDDKFIVVTEDGYPATLKSMSKPPFLVFYEGDLTMADAKDLVFVNTGETTKVGPEHMVTIEDDGQVVNIGGKLKIWTRYGYDAIIGLAKWISENSNIKERRN
jgi:hypothetical protein